MNKRPLCGLMVIVLTGTAAQANEVSLSFGATIASEYVSNGIRYSDGPVAQPYFEVGLSGFYAGAYASNIDADLTGADTEYGLSLGYRGEAGSISYDAGLASYLYDEASPDVPVQGLSVGATYAVTEQVSLGTGYHDTNFDPALGLFDTNGLVVASASVAF